MRVLVVKVGVLSALVAALVAQAATTHALTAAAPASDSSPAPAATLSFAAGLTTVGAPEGFSTVVDIPGAWSFDDAHGGISITVQSLASTTTAARRLVVPRKPPKPPTRARSGAMPAAGTPQAVLAAAYIAAAAKAPRGCHLSTAHLAAIGQVESGSVGGRHIGADHRVSPAIYGPLLDGGPFAVVHDSDRGAYDGASDYDRAVGPLQFLPGTWRWAGRDGDGDGRRDPQNVYDAAMATADYLCRDGRDLSRPGDLRAAILTYNWSGEYVAAVSQWVSFFTRHGLAALDDVAFRVGSGGRASDMALAAPDRAKAEAAAKAKATAKAKAAAKAKVAKTVKASLTPGATPTPTRPTSPTATPTGPATPTPSPSVTTPAPAPTTPAPTPTTPAPAPTTPAPDPTTPTPDPTTPAPDPTTPAPSATPATAPVPPVTTTSATTSTGPASTPSTD